MEKLYNNITLPDVWPPRDVDFCDKSVRPVPYLENKPDIIDISVGRQLFVDDFLIAETDLERVPHKAVKNPSNPVFVPETPLETEFSLPCACPKSGGVWYDKYQGKYRMWYEAGWLHRLAYAESEDGINWVRPDLDVVPGTNQILPEVTADSSAVIIDYDTDKADERYKLFIRAPGGPMAGFAYVSADGIHWKKRTQTDNVEDRSTIFYNPFRKKWVYSIRRCVKEPIPVGRIRDYRECDDYLAGAKWYAGDAEKCEKVQWLATDELDLPDPKIGMAPQLYNFDAVAYESIMLGMFQIHRGPENKDCNAKGMPKITELIAAYSRDGFNFTRPDREAFIPASREVAEWDRGYVQSVGGVCVICGDELRFYYIGFEGDEKRTEPSGKLNGMHDHSSTGYATLRRDGFMSLDGTGYILTEKLCTASGRDRLFINAKAPHGTVTAEILDENGVTVAGFEKEEFVPFTGNSTKAELVRKSKNKLPDVFRIKFHLKNAQLYSFWFSEDQNGDSHGYDAAGKK